VSWLLARLVSAMQFDREKFKSLLHYVIARAGDRDGFGAVKLYKVLWFSDARAYMLHGAPITGETYIREKYGPLPMHAQGVLNELAQQNTIRVWSDVFHNRQIRRFSSLTNPDKLTLPKEQRAIVEYWIKHIAEDHTAESISEQSHDLAWELAELKEPIPYHAIFASRIRDPEGKELEWAASRAKELGLS
jgi:hypothetical protein